MDVKFSSHCSESRYSIYTFVRPPSSTHAQPHRGVYLLSGWVAWSSAPRGGVTEPDYVYDPNVHNPRVPLIHSPHRFPPFPMVTILTTPVPRQSRSPSHQPPSPPNVIFFVVILLPGTRMKHRRLSAKRGLLHAMSEEKDWEGHTAVSATGT